MQYFNPGFLNESPSFTAPYWLSKEGTLTLDLTVLSLISQIQDCSHLKHAAEAFAERGLIIFVLLLKYWRTTSSVLWLHCAN